jgi:hypothetical protein
MFRESLALSFVLLSLAGAAEVQSITDSSSCFKLPDEYQEACISSTKAGHPYSFKVLQSTPSKLVIQPLDSIQNGNSAPLGMKSPGTEEREAAALEKLAESSQQTATAVTVMAGLEVAGVVVAGIVSIILFLK